MDPLAIGTALRCIAVGFIWGASQAGLKHVDTLSPNLPTSVANDLASALSNWKWVALYGLNQLGSVLFYYNLASSELSIAVPVTQACTLMFTTLTALALGEEIKGDFKWVLTGSVLVLCGIMVMIM